MFLNLGKTTFFYNQGAVFRNRNLILQNILHCNIVKSAYSRCVHIMSGANAATVMAEESSSNSRLIERNPQEYEPILRLNNIEKSQQDTRNYRGLQLENGLKVLLISDPETDVSAAAMAVHVGHMSDPDNLPGLAHFCEHMLFLGTKKYPHENGYTTYLSQSGGSSNAATYPLMTKYHFHVLPDKLANALDRFAQFFIEPLFTASATEREINAVNSEHEKNLSSDVWRIKQVHRHLAKPDHPYSKFGSGNKSTLYDIPKEKNIDVRSELLNFHNRWYSANIMSLAVLGKESLNDLESMVMQKFSEIKNKNVTVPSWQREPFELSKYAQKTMVVPVKDLRSLTISFTTDDLTHLYKSAPESYLTHLIGHEGKGSVLSELRKRGWCNDLMAGHHNTLNGFGFFEIVVDLTQEGLQHVDEIITVLFQYLRLLREEGPKKWIFDECVNLNEMRFRFKDKEQPESLVTNAVTYMLFYPLEEVLTAPYLNNDWQPDLIMRLLNELVPAKCRVLLVGQSYEKEAVLQEPYYKTKYCNVDIEPDTLKRWEECELNEHLSLPQPNAFIPESFDLLPMDNDLGKHPVIVLDTPILRVWHKQDDKFLKPKACMNFDMSNPTAYMDPLSCNLNQMVLMLLKDQLNEYLYNADLAGLKFVLTPKSTGIEFTLRGYSDKQIVMLEKILDHLFDFQIDRQRFDIMREDYMRSLKNFNAEQPYQHAIYYLAVILSESAWTNGELKDAMQLVTYERVLNYAREFFQRVHTECFIYGNVNKQKALDVGELVNKRLECTNAMVLPLLARQILMKREYKLCFGDSYLFEQSNEYHKSSCAELYFQCGAQTDFKNVMVTLIAQMLTEPCYDCLRTKEQLGYIVFSGVRKVNGVNGLRVLVQSTRHPAFVEQRIEKFIETFQNMLENMPQDEFERHKESLILKKLEKTKTIYQQFVKFYMEIVTAQYHFDRDEAEVALLRNITKEDVLEAYKTMISRDGNERRVMAVHILSTQLSETEPTAELEQCEESIGDECATPAKKHTKIIDLIDFKSSKELYPLMLPTLDIRPKGARSKL